MSKQLMKLKIEVDTSTEIEPTDNRFFYITTTQIDPEETLTIDAEDFFDDTGNEVTELPILIENNHFYNVFINGVLQMKGISTYTAGEEGSLVIEVPENDKAILAGTPVVLEIVNYNPESTNNVIT